MPKFLYAQPKAKHPGGRPPLPQEKRKPRKYPHVSIHSPAYDCGACRLSLMDVIRLLPEARIRDWDDFRARNLRPAMEAAYQAYLAAGGMVVLTGSTKSSAAYLAPNRLTSLPILEQITGYHPWSENEIMESAHLED